MKKLMFLILATCSVLLSGCFENTVEITLKEDGSGTYVYTDDMNAMISLLKEMSKNDTTGMAESKMDTTYSLAAEADSLTDLTAEEKILMKKGTIHAILNPAEEQGKSIVMFPLSPPAEISKLTDLSSKIALKPFTRGMGQNEDLDSALKSMPGESSIEDYYTTNYSSGLLIRTLKKEKYATLDQNKMMTGMKEMAAMGLTSSLTYIFNLPRPAKKVEGKNVKLSTDKMKVTVKMDIEDLFDDGAMGEFRIEY